MIADEAYFPTPSSLGFVIFKDDNQPQSKFVQKLDLGTNKISGFSKVDFSDENLLPIQSENETFIPGMIGVVARVLGTGEVELLKMPATKFDKHFCNSLRNSERKSYINSFVRELGWTAIASKAKNDLEAKYIKENLSCFDFEIDENKEIKFMDFSGKYSEQDTIVRDAIGIVNISITELGLLEFLENYSQSGDHSEQVGKFDVFVVASFIKSSTRQEERIAKLLRALLETNDRKDRLSIIEFYKDSAKFASFVISFLKPMVSRANNIHELELYVASSVSKMYNECHWPNGVHFLYQLAVYLRGYPEVSNEIKRLLHRSRSLPVLQNKHAILDILDSSDKSPAEAYKNRYIHSLLK